MQTKEYTTTDKSEWGEGPWQSEPDKIQWPDEDTGLPCLIVRNKGGGNLCGYVGVGTDHPLYGMDYSDVEENHAGYGIVHGGLTFSGPCRVDSHESRGICHVPDPGETDDVWWLGFDCAHYLDIRPAAKLVYAKIGMDPGPEDVGAEYRTVEYVQNECRDLARYLASVTKNKSDRPSVPSVG